MKTLKSAPQYQHPKKTSEFQIINYWVSKKRQNCLFFKVPFYQKKSLPHKSSLNRRNSASCVDWRKNFFTSSNIFALFEISAVFSRGDPWIFLPKSAIFCQKTADFGKNLPIQQKSRGGSISILKKRQKKIKLIIGSPKNVRIFGC